MIAGSRTLLLSCALSRTDTFLVGVSLVVGGLFETDGLVIRLTFFLFLVAIGDVIPMDNARTSFMKSSLNISTRVGSCMSMTRMLVGRCPCCFMDPMP